MGVGTEPVFTWLDGEVTWDEGAKTLKKPGDVVTLEVENLVGREKAPEKPASRCSGGVVGSLTGPDTPALASSRASWSISCFSLSCCRSRSFMSSSNLRLCSLMYSMCWRFFSNWTSQTNLDKRTRSKMMPGLKLTSWDL